MNFNDLPKSKQRFFEEAQNGGAKMNLDLLRFYTKVNGNEMKIIGLEMDELNKIKYASNAEALNAEQEWWLNMNNIIDYNHRYLVRTYSANPGKCKMLESELLANLKRFFNENKDFGYYLE